jgi:hypothetical protein
VCHMRRRIHVCHSFCSALQGSKICQCQVMCTNGLWGKGGILSGVVSSSFDLTTTNYYTEPL